MNKSYSLVFTFIHSEYNILFLHHIIIMAATKMRTVTLRLPNDEANLIEFTADEYGLTMSQVVRRCVKIAMDAWFYIGVQHHAVHETDLPSDSPSQHTAEARNSIPKPEYDVGAVIMSGMNKKNQNIEDEPFKPGYVFEDKIEHNFDTPKTNVGSDTPNTIQLVDAYSPNRPPFELIPIADFNEIPEDSIPEALRNLRRFSPELQDYGTTESQASVQARLNPTPWIVDETSSSYVEDALPIPPNRIVSRELLFFPSETVETPNWPMQMPNLLIGRLHPLNERDRIDALIDTGRIAEFFPQKIVEQIKKYDDKVMPKKLYESRVARQVARRNEDKKQKEDEEFERMLEAEDA